MLPFIKSQTTTDVLGRCSAVCVAGSVVLYDLSDIKYSGLLGERTNVTLRSLYVIAIPSVCRPSVVCL